MRRISPLLAVALTLPAAAAFAAPRDITVQVSNAGLSRVAQEVPPLLPNTMNWPGMTKNLFGCPFSSSSATAGLTNVKVNLKIESVKVTPSTGKITVDLSGRVPSGSATGSFYVCVGSRTSCPIYFSSSSVSARATFTPRVSGGAIKLGSPTVSLNVSSSATKINVANCGVLGSVLNKAEPYFRGWLLDRIEGWIEDAVLKQVPPAVEKALAGLTEYSGTLNGFKVTGSLRDVSSATSGLKAGIDLSVVNTTTASGSCAVGSAPTPRSVTSSAYLGSFSEHVGVAASSEVISKTLNAAWRSGMFCFTDSRLKALGVTGAASNAGGLLGMSKIDSMSAKVPQPLRVKLVSGTSGIVEITAPSVVELKGQTSVGPATITAKADVLLKSRLRMDPTTRALVFEVTEITAGTLTLTSSNPKLVLPKPALVKAAVEALAFPAIKDSIGKRTLIPQVLHRSGGVLDPYYLYIKRRSNTSTHLKMFGMLHKKVSTDTLAPWTNMTKKPPKLYGAEAFEFVATGGDGGTPTDLLRFRWRVDGGSWSYASYGRSLIKSFKTGNHKVEVKAVDLHGNEDKTPSTVSFEVDALKPTLNVRQAPGATIKADNVTIEVGVNDNRSPASKIAVSMRFEQIINATPKLLGERPFVAGVTRFALNKLAPGSYAVTLIARDEAGNVSTPARVTFTREGAGGPGQPGNPPENPEPPQPGTPGTPGGTNPGDPNAPGGGGNGQGGVGSNPSDVNGGCALAASSSGDAGSALPLGAALLLLVVLAARRRRRR